MIEKALKAKLESIVGFDGIVYPLAAPEGKDAPYLVYARSSTNRIPTLVDQGSYKTSFTLTLAEKSYSKMVDKRALVRNSIQFATGVFKAGTPEVLNLLIVNENEFYDPEMKEYIGVLDIEIIYN